MNEMEEKYKQLQSRNKNKNVAIVLLMIILVALCGVIVFILINDKNDVGGDRTSTDDKLEEQQPNNNTNNTNTSDTDDNESALAVSDVKITYTTKVKEVYTPSSELDNATVVYANVSIKGSAAQQLELDTFDVNEKDTLSKATKISQNNIHVYNLQDGYVVILYDGADYWRNLTKKIAIFSSTGSLMEEIDLNTNRMEYGIAGYTRDMPVKFSEKGIYYLSIGEGCGEEDEPNNLIEHYISFENDLASHSAGYSKSETGKTYKQEIAGQC